MGEESYIVNTVSRSSLTQPQLDVFEKFSN